EFGRIARLTQRAGTQLSPLQREIARVSRLVAALATLLGAVFFAIGQAIGLSFWSSFLFAIGIIVANVPEGLLPTVTLALAMATQRMAARNALVRHLPAVETLGAATVICTDKTGTLTLNRMTARQAFVAGQLLASEQLVGPACRPLLEGAALCHGLKAVNADGRGEWLGDPMEIALVELGRARLASPPAWPKLDEIPFDSERKRLSTVHRDADGDLRLYCKGAPETVLPLCDRVQSASGALPLDASGRQVLLAAQEAMTGQGLRVLAFAWKPLPQGYTREGLEQGLILAGLVALEDPPRPEVPAAVRQCREAGIRIVMITGDHSRTALAIAREIGLTGAEPRIVTGDELRRMTDTQLQLALDAPEILFARAGAEQKLRIVAALQRKREIVAVTGDGVNDAPALRQADIGVAMGLSGTDVAKEAADLVLLDDNFASIVAAVAEGRAVYDNIRKFLTYILTSNIPEIVPYLAFVLLRIPLPLTVIQILAVDLGTDMLPALGLGAERPDPGVMRRPPRPRQERLLTWPLVARAYLFLGLIEAAVAMAAFFLVLYGGGWHYGTVPDPALYARATAATLSAIIVMQAANVFLCRHPHACLATTGLGGNALILWGVAVELALILLIDYSAWGNRLFGTAPLELGTWLFLLPCAAALVVLEEGRKWLVRRERRRLRRRPAPDSRA
ncbi:MAG TPA: cation-transporting P-type ATPase, partial [Candidatus Competibacteraceae bacterium]|nr:cation-transporting P-type ATPase [Candidatus Competibacteraceae bacterium]